MGELGGVRCCFRCCFGVVGFFCRGEGVDALLVRTRLAGGGCSASSFSCPLAASPSGDEEGGERRDDDVAPRLRLVVVVAASVLAMLVLGRTEWRGRGLPLVGV